MSTINVNSIDKESGSTLTLGGSGTQVTVHASATTSGFPEAGLASMQTFTSSGTWTRPTGITKVIIEVQGAGAGGSNDYQHNWARNGGGGGYCKKFLDVSSISTSTITVGSGGAGIVRAGTPNAGGDSSWADGTNTITGGGAPAPSPSNSATGFRGGAGGTATGGDINIPGGLSMSEYSDAGPFGMSVLGISGYCQAVTSTYQPSTSLMDGIGYGSGGGGRIDPSSGYSLLSGAGADGIVVVWEYK